MQIETREELDSATERLTQAAAALEAAAARLNTFDLEATQSREQHLAAQLAEAEATIKHLQATALQTTTNRKTTAPGTLLAREGMAREGIALEAGALGGALDQALACLGIEQRIAVKAQLLRTGLLG